jgi:AcrR family transcriptional regulator
MTDTPLSLRLAAAASRTDALTAFTLARRTFIEGRKIEMQELAAELAVNRATLFRWVGGRDDLLAEVIWSVTEPTLAAAMSGASGVGGRRVASAVGRFAVTVHESKFFVGFVQREPERALRLLTTRASTYQRRLIDYVESTLQAEIDAGHLDPPLPVHDLAVVVVRIAETFLYTDMITGDTPDASKVEQALTALLR